MPPNTAPHNDRCASLLGQGCDCRSPWSNRPWTPDVVEGGTTTMTVKRCCNGCQRNLGDATDAEMDAAIEGRPLPDVREECGCATHF